MLELLLTTVAILVALGLIATAIRISLVVRVFASIARDLKESRKMVKGSGRLDPFIPSNPRSDLTGYYFTISSHTCESGSCSVCSSAVNVGDSIL